MGPTATRRWRTPGVCRLPAPSKPSRSATRDRGTGLLTVATALQQLIVASALQQLIVASAIQQLTVASALQKTHRKASRQSVPSAFYGGTGEGTGWLHGPDGGEDAVRAHMER